MNGLATNVGGIGSGLVALFVGFRMTVVLALVIYFLAALAFRRLGRLTASPLAG